MFRMKQTNTKCGFRLVEAVLTYCCGGQQNTDYTQAAEGKKNETRNKHEKAKEPGNGHKPALQEE